MLGLSQEEGAQLVEAYVKSRNRYRNAQKESRQAETQEKSREVILRLREQERERLAAVLKTILTEDQVALAIQALGGFNPKWDRHVRTLVGFNLDEEKMSAALKLVSKFNIDYQVARSTGTNTRGLSESLDNDLAQLLSETQLAQ